MEYYNFETETNKQKPPKLDVYSMSPERSTGCQSWKKYRFLVISHKQFDIMKWNFMRALNKNYLYTHLFMILK